MGLLPLLLASALADDPAWPLRREVAQVTLEAPEGGLPRENLEPLLRVHQGDPLDLGDLHQDVAALARVGEFAAVEAYAEPWSVIGADGEPQEAVHVIYRVYPPPRIRRVDLVGLRGPARTVVEDTLGLARGQAFYPDQETAAVEERIVRALREAGYGLSRAQLLVEPTEDGLDLRVNVVPGPVHRFRDIAITGDEVVEPRTLRRWLRPAGVARHRRINTRALVRGRDLVREHLVREGYLESIANLVLVPAEDDPEAEDLRVIVDAGPRLVLHTHGRGLPRGANLVETLGLAAGDRIARESTADLEERLERWFRERGWFEADVRLERELRGSEVHLDIEVRRGRRHTLGHISVTGSHAFSEKYIAGALREAAPETLGDGIVTEDAVVAALGVVREFYRSQGFLDARLHLDGLTQGRGGVSGVPVQVAVSVAEGPRTWLVSLETAGSVRVARTSGALGPVIEASLLQQARGELLGKPYNPARLDSLALEVANAYREAGYLNADVRAEVALSPIDDTRGEARAVLRVSAGEQIRLRSVLVAGNRHTRRSVITRELRTTVGEPITPEQLLDTRSALYALDLFRSVSPELVGDDDRSRDLVLHVDEKPNVLLELGGGVSTDEGMAARATATHRNLGGLGQRISALGQVGVGWYGDTWAIDASDLSWRASVRYEAPYFPARGYKLVSEILLNEELQETYWRLSRSGASVGIQGRWGAHTEAFLDYHFQFRKLLDADPGVLVVGEPWWPQDTSGLGVVPETPTGWRTQGGLGFTVVYDGRDDRFNPRRGTLGTLSLELADPISTDVPFVKASALAEQLVPLGPVVLDLTARGGISWVSGERTTLAVEDRFTLGGSGSLRGFGLDAVGPANRSSRPDVAFPGGLDPAVDGTSLHDTPTHWVPTGGDTLAAGTAELRVPLSTLGLGSDSTSLVIFGDAGALGFLDPDVVTTSLQERAVDPALDPVVRVGVGAGLHLQTPIGPLSFDLGVNTNPLEARDERWVVPHLSLGAL